MKNNKVKQDLQNDKYKKPNKSNLRYYFDDKGRKVYFNNFELEAETNNELSLNENIELNKPKIVSEFIDSENVINKTHNYKLDINLLDGESKVFYCDICKLDMQDSSAYIEHLNGKLHNSKIGLNMKVRKIGVEKVREKLESLKSKSELDIIRMKLSNYVKNI